jgi:hypothetical protein
MEIIISRRGKKEVCPQLYQLTMRFPFYLLLGQIGIASEKLRQ